MAIPADVERLTRQYMDDLAKMGYRVTSVDFSNGTIESDALIKAAECERLAGLTTESDLKAHYLAKAKELRSG